MGGCPAILHTPASRPVATDDGPRSSPFPVQSCSLAMPGVVEVLILVPTGVFFLFGFLFGFLGIAHMAMRGQVGDLDAIQHPGSFADALDGLFQLFMGELALDRQVVLDTVSLGELLYLGFDVEHGFHFCSLNEITRKVPKGPRFSGRKSPMPMLCPASVNSCCAISGERS